MWPHTNSIKATEIELKMTGFVRNVARAVYLLREIRYVAVVRSGFVPSL
jgi:hypothetical protein